VATLTTDHFTPGELEQLRTEAYDAQVRANGGSNRGVVRPLDLAPFLASQISRSELEKLTPPEISAAHHAGRLAALTVTPAAYGRAMADELPEQLGTASNAAAAADATGWSSLVNQLTRADLASMTPREISDAYKAGRLAHMTGGHTSSANGRTALDG
jgi:hypothetical protein